MQRVEQVLDALLATPTRSVRGEIAIRPMAPVSLVTTGQIGSFYYSDARPSRAMVLGLLENAMGLWFEQQIREAFAKDLEKAHPSLKWVGVGAGWISLLQHHVLVLDSNFPKIVRRLTDVQSRMTNDGAKSAANSQRQRDWRLRKIMMHGGSVTGAGIAHGGEELAFLAVNDVDELLRVVPKKPDGTFELKFDVVDAILPKHYPSPRRREYIVTSTPFIVPVETTDVLARLIDDAVKNPIGNLFLGSNDGNVEATWTQIS